MDHRPEAFVRGARRPALGAGPRRAVHGHRRRLGGASGTQAAILFVGVAASSVLLLVLLGRTIGGRSESRVALWASAAPVIDVLAYAIVLVPGGGLSACDDADAAALTSVSTPAGVELQDQPGNSEGSCAQAFVASVPLSDVMSGYRASLGSGGWTVQSERTQPGSAEGGGSVETGELSAQRGAATFWVTVESGPGEAGGTYVGGSITADTSTGA